jgi:dTDP-4-amino-4,6-dideoxygalactose transaminase
MWVRKRLDFGYADVLYGLTASCRRLDRSRLVCQVRQSWTQAAECLPCLSVRSGFDLLLQVLGLPHGGEVLMSAVTIHDMVRIVHQHGLTPVPLDVDLRTMAPPVEAVERAISPRSRVIVLAHLFGGRAPIDPIIEIARQHRLLVVEDCAQAFAGSQYQGHPLAEVSMFSFGPIKTATALGGAVLHVRDNALLERLQAAHQTWPVQPEGQFRRRLLKYAMLKFLSARIIVRSVVGVYRAAGWDYDRMINGSVRGFPGPDFWRRIRRQPASSLLGLLARRLQTYDFRRVQRRTRSGEFLRQQLAGAVALPGKDCLGRTHWVFPVMAENPQRLVAALLDGGFDATQGQSLCVVPAPTERAGLRALRAEEFLAKVVFLPIYPELPQAAVEKMAAIVRTQAVLDGVLSPPLEQATQPTEENHTAHHGCADGRNQHGGAADVQGLAKLGVHFVGERPSH